MPYFETIRNRIAYAREKDLFSQSIAPAAPVLKGSDAAKRAEEQNTNPLKADQNRLISADFQILLCIYDHRGIEWSISPQGARRAERPLPRRGWYHKHEYVEILYVIEGGFDQFLLGERYHFPEGAFVITDQNCEHSDYIEAVDAAVLFLQIQPEYLDELLRSYPKTDELHRFLLHALYQQKREQSFLELTASPKAAPLLRLLEQIVEEDLNRLPGYEHIRRGLLIRLLKTLCTDYSLVRHSSSQEGKEKAFLYELERYIRLHDADVTLRNLEQVFHYHRNYFTLILQKYRGQTFREYVQKVRLDHALQLLRETTLPIRHIAAVVGYENTSHFYHLFENKFEVSPRQVRDMPVK